MGFFGAKFVIASGLLLVGSANARGSIVSEPVNTPVPTQSASSLQSVKSAPIKPSVTPSISPSTTPSISPIPQVSASPAVSVTDAECKGLLREFRKAQSSEASALRHRHGSELNELKASHRARKREWDQHEVETRRKFFEEHTKGSERRTYIMDLLERRKAFLKALDDEVKERKNQQKVRKESLRSEQKSRLQEFEASLSRRERPQSGLWPSSGL